MSKTEDPRVREIKRQLNDYFSRQQDRKLADFRIRQQSTLVTWVVMLLIGLVLALVPVVKMAITEAVDWQQMLEEQGQRFMLPGLFLVVIASISRLWTNGWPRPLALAVAVAALCFYAFQIGNVFVIAALAFVAVVMLGWDLFDWLSGRTDPKELGELEKEIDGWIDEQFLGLRMRAAREVPIPPDRFDFLTIMLKSFPKADRSRQVLKLARIGTDKKPRVSPIGVAGFGFGAESAVVFEGAVDLVSQGIVYARVHEFDFRDIVSLTWSSDASPPPDTKSDTKSKLPAMLPTAAKIEESKVVPRRDQLEIRLASDQVVSIVFRDSTIHDNLRNQDFQPIEDLDKIRDVWFRLAEGRERARQNSPVS